MIKAKLFNLSDNKQNQSVLNKIKQIPEVFDDADYYEAANSWRVQIYQSQAVWLNRSMLANVMLGSLLLVSILVIFKQTNAHIVEPIIIEKDKSTGAYSVIDRVTPGTISDDWSTTRFNLMQYVESREQYHTDNLNIPYQDAYYKSSDSVASELAKELGSDNANSPLNIYGDKKYITISVNNIQKFDNTDANNSALVEFTKTLHEKGSSQTKDFHYRAIVKWEYATDKMELKNYYRNPFNFRVFYYKASLVSTNT